MKSKILKISLAILLIMTMTFTNFIFVGSSLISYAANDVETNHKNIDFETYFVNSNNQPISSYDLNVGEDLYLYLAINVKKEGYFKGEVTLDDAGFTLKESDSSFVSKVEDNKLTLNQINANSKAEMKVKVELKKDEVFNIGNLNKENKITLKGTYYDSTEKDISIESTREVKLELVESYNSDNVKNNLQVITNKILKVDGEDKRVIQLLWDVGLVENSYPIKQIDAKINVPVIDKQYAEVSKIVNFNTMTYYDYSYDGSNVTFQFTNNPNEDNNIHWKKDGNERIILTYVYDKDVTIQTQDISAEQKLTLYDQKEVVLSQKVSIDSQEKDQIVSISSYAEETSMYKGKLYAGIHRTYITNTNVDINLASTVDKITVQEETNQNVLKDVYENTTVSKDSFDELFGAEGALTIYNENNEVIGKIDASSTADDNNNIVINYSNEPSIIRIETTKPIKEGTLVLKNTKKLSNQGNDINDLTQVGYKTTVKYNDQAINQEVVTNIELQQTKTQSKFEIDKDSLSTIVNNELEIRATLLQNSEQYDLYQNPTFTFELPEQVQNIEITNVGLLYEDELTVGNYHVDGRNIQVSLQGKQTKYKDVAVEGAVLIINANISVNRKSASADTNINMYYTNESAHSYVNEGDRGIETKPIKVVAPKDVAAINNIPDLQVETMGEEESRSVALPKGDVEKQLQVQAEVINTQENNIKNIKILGVFPTDNDTDNNMGITIVNPIQLSNTEGTAIYYTDNENATDDIQNSENGWTQNLTESAKKYLIVVDSLQSQESLGFNYTIKIPQNLEYNKVAKGSYVVNYTNEATSVANNIKSTVISLETGVGPKIESTLSASRQGSVKNGEVIQYNIKISNTGSEDIANLTVKGQVPEGTTLVVPQDNYEYTGTGYYDELEDKEYIETIENLKVGETRNVNYEVRVNSDTSEGTHLNNTVNVKYGEANQDTNTIELTTEKGDLRVTVKRVTDRNTSIYEGSIVQYFAIIENISDEMQEDVTVKTALPEEVEVSSLYLLTGMKEESGEGIDIVTGEGEEQEGTAESSVESEEIEYQDEINIGDINPGEAKVLCYYLQVNEVNDNNIDFSVVATDGEKEYVSNTWEDQIKTFDLSMSMASNTETQYVRAGDVIEYTINIKNNSNSTTSGLTITDNVPSQLEIQEVTVDGEVQELDSTNNIVLLHEVGANQESNIVIKAIVNDSDAREQAEAITNIAYAQVGDDVIAQTNEVTHIIQVTSTGGNGEDDENNNVDDNDVAQGNMTITGVAWYDENSNGIRDENEPRLNGVTVRLLNTETNNLVKDAQGNVLEATTNDNGIYVLDKIGNGKYIAIFDYDDTQYTLTKYKITGATEENNSDVLMNTLNIDGQETRVASTDIIEVNNDNISGINIGLVTLQDFDLKLDKYVSKIILQNSQGTTVREYQDSTMAKAEIDAKQVNGTTAIIEYQIKVTNAGEIPGYAKQIADYIPSDLSFSSELNKDWYQTGDTLYTSVLANDVINPGESKTITLTLVKSMTENNTGRINNRAEITEDYNDLGIGDMNSTPGNQASDENDLGSADVILSIRTGGGIYIGIVIAIVLVLVAVGIVIVKKKNNKEEI